MEKKTVYLETSFISYLTSRPNRDVVIAGHQAITHEWWNSQRHRYELFISETVLEEAGEGDQLAAERRLALLEPLEVLRTPDELMDLVAGLISRHAVPEKALADAVHIALACVYGINYLLTWNCKHIANADRRHLIEQVSMDFGYTPPIICTPEELTGEH
jgi:predicted nucleic acid-binding protein